MSTKSDPLTIIEHVSSTEETAKRFVHDFTEHDAQDEEYWETVSALQGLLAAAVTDACKSGDVVSREHHEEEIDELRERLELMTMDYSGARADRKGLQAALVALQSKHERLTAAVREAIAKLERGERAGDLLRRALAETT